MGSSYHRTTSGHCGHHQEQGCSENEAVGKATVEVMFDSGSAVSLLWKSDVNRMSSVQHVHKQPRVRLVTAAGEPLPVVGIVQAPVQVAR